MTLKNPAAPRAGRAAAAGSDTWNHKVWLARMKQDLLGPASAILELSADLLKDAADQGRESFRADVDKIHRSASKLLALLHELLDPDRAVYRAADFQRRLRHDLRTPLNHVIGYCEIWLEDAASQLMEGFVADLVALRDHGKKLVVLVDDLLHAPPPGPEKAPPPGATTAIMLAPRAPAAQPRPGAARILVVDDDETSRDMLARRLRREGHHVAAVAGGREALALVRERPFDLILLDVLMPQMNGLEVLRCLKAPDGWRDIPVIMVSAFDDVDSIAGCIELGAEDYLPKPFNRTVLLARVDACLERKHLRDRERSYLEQIERERQRADELLHVILPGDVVTELKATNSVRPRRHERVAVLFCDLVEFTHYCDGNEPEQVVRHLQQLIEHWEEIALRHQVQKIKTIGDAFMAAAGLSWLPADEPVLRCLRCGLEMIAAAHALPVKWDARVGVHVGPVVAGVIGRRQYLFDLWGDTVNTAARMESNGVAGAVTFSRTAWEQVAGQCHATSLGLVPVKGKGHQEMFRFDDFKKPT